MIVIFLTKYANNGLGYKLCGFALIAPSAGKVSKFALQGLPTKYFLPPNYKKAEKK